MLVLATHLERELRLERLVAHRAAKVAAAVLGLVVPQGHRASALVAALVARLGARVAQDVPPEAPLGDPAGCWEVFLVSWLDFFLFVFVGILPGFAL